jgi:hypothetical protein
MLVIPSRADGEGPHSRRKDYARSLSRFTQIGVTVVVVHSFV